jgi:hypothetical protein
MAYDNASHPSKKRKLEELVHNEFKAMRGVKEDGARHSVSHFLEHYESYRDKCNFAMIHMYRLLIHLGYENTPKAYEIKACLLYGLIPWEMVTLLVFYCS